MGLKVIVAGLSKTGTTSVCDALRHLGLIVHDMPEHIKIGYELYRDLFEGKNVSTARLRDFYKDVDAVTDLPAALYWDKLQEAFPEATVLHLVRPDSEAWFRSAEDFFTSKDTYRWLYQRKCPWLYATRFIAYGQVKPDRQLWIKAYEQYNTALQHRANIDTRVQLYRITEGWTPLCRILNISIPNIPFPVSNKGKNVHIVIFNKIVGKKLKLFAILLLFAAAMLPVSSTYGKGVALLGAVIIWIGMIVIPPYFQSQYDVHLLQQSNLEQQRLHYERMLVTQLDMKEGANGGE